MSLVRQVLKNGIRTSADASALTIALMADAANGAIDIATVSVINKSLAHLLRIKDLEARIGEGEGQFTFSSSLEPGKPSLPPAEQRIQCNQCEAKLLRKELGEHKSKNHPITNL